MAELCESQGDVEDLESWLDGLYGAQTADWRNLTALSSKGALAEQLPPTVSESELIYGEFRLRDFLRAIDDACALRLGRLSAPARAIVDVGSGAGRLVLGLARQRPEYKVVGLEIQEPLHDLATAALAASGLDNARFVAGNLHDGPTARAALGGADVVFVYSTAMDAEGDDVASRLSGALAPVLLAGAVVVTTDRRLCEVDFELAESEHGLPGSISGATVDLYFWRRRSN